MGAWRAPTFWWQEKRTWPSLLLAPIGALYGAITALRMKRRGARVDVPVICVGNFIAGGAGKTPTALAVAAMLVDMGEKPVFLSRGYGSKAGQSPTPVQVDAAIHSAADVGDEPLLLARVAPVFVCADRLVGAKAAIAAGASVLVMDDGLQNRSLHQDMRLAVVDGASGIGNGACVPAGPLRAPLKAQLPYVSALVLIGAGEPGERVAARAEAASIAVHRGALKADQGMAAKLKGQKVFAFAGIGLPQKFYATLTALGADIIATKSFGDHQPYMLADLQLMHRQATRMGALLVTTDKDFVRLQPLAEELSWHGIAPLAVPVRLTFDDDAPLRALLARALKKS